MLSSYIIRGYARASSPGATDGVIWVFYIEMHQHQGKGRRLPGTSHLFYLKEISCFWVFDCHIVSSFKALFVERTMILIGNEQRERSCNGSWNKKLKVQLENWGKITISYWRKKQRKRLFMSNSETRSIGKQWHSCKSKSLLSNLDSLERDEKRENRLFWFQSYELVMLQYSIGKW